MKKNLGDIHDRDSTGILARGKRVDDSAVAETGETEDDSEVAETGEDSGESEDDPPNRYGGFDSIKEDAGPGMRLGTYLPKRIDLATKINDSLTPSDGSAAVASPHNDRKVDGIKFK